MRLLELYVFAAPIVMLFAAGVFARRLRLAAERLKKQSEESRLALW
jgi:hypothetical protein